MIVKIKRTADPKDIANLKEHLQNKGFEIHDSVGKTYSLFGVVGDTAGFDLRSLYAFHCVDSVIRVQEPFKKVNRKFQKEDTIIEVGDVKIGGDEVIIMAGPCSVESFEQVDIIAKAVKASGAKILRGGAFKPRTSPYSYQGMGVEGLKILREIGDKYDMPIISELMSTENINDFIKYVDIIQIGARNMQNFALLKELGKIDKPVMLKRGFSNTIEEWLMSAEYIMAGGNHKVILCERGIRTFEPYTRNTLDISTVPIVKKLSHLPVVIDPSHAAGKWDYVESLSMASIAAGADGLIIEVHHEPENAMSDGAQSLKPKKFNELMKKARVLAAAVNKKV
ncbi:Phospho-2-dehydro-3-deoxyheptonate aldolase [Candidatus Izimaplasma bacterium HR1]|jgi:3-deoxy-7-phosphoheptulonate synthase|uniref:3-deoxy-7-phosphoheptulonate synthase n=1 Tax=Candidatus Izimoplasma sp. HR1 TaxID=1541959 RepID=UPI0004F869BF|nr:Phospho-2-dehydro-3-deoxyheptonate aldolase [Candidatus Izimaplasma bacterium HR1]